MVRNKKTGKRSQVKKGLVVSDKMEKTIIVEVTHLATNAKYRRKYKVSKRYMVHDEKEEYKPGDKVMIVSTRPVSKNKSWKVIGKA